MAVSLPGDIVFDVVRAAEPKAKAAARAGLERAGELAGIPAVSRADGPDSAGGAGATRKPENAGKTFVDFEAMVLQTFVQSMLPDEAESVYGSGLSGNMWKSLLAQEMGRAMAEGGGVGIADRLLSDYSVQGEQRVPLRGASADPGNSEADRQAMLSSALLDEFQRIATQAIGVGGEGVNGHDS